MSDVGEASTVLTDRKGEAESTNPDPESTAGTRRATGARDGTVYVGSNDDNLYAVDAAYDEEAWVFETKDDVLSSSALADGTVYVGSRDWNLSALTEP